jgi:SAM-dependent methyltransferase
MKAERPDYRKIARLYGHRWHYHYALTKLRTDPVYPAVLAALANAPAAFPLLDLGCGLGLLAFYLRERGYPAPILGADYDPRKIDHARSIVAEHDYQALAFRLADAREGVPDFQGNVTVLDILQFFRANEQTRLLEAAARSVAPGGLLIIRSCLRDKSWRFHATHAGDIFARLTFWMKSAPVHYPTRESLDSALRSCGLEGEITPLWGRTPFNNYLACYRRVKPNSL